jgi:hypothetical protein
MVGAMNTAPLTILPLPLTAQRDANCFRLRPPTKPARRNLLARKR